LFFIPVLWVPPRRTYHLRIFGISLVIVVIALIASSLNLMNTGLDQVFNPTLRE
jgi:hypothetical protein